MTTSLATILLDDSVFGGISDLNKRRDNYQALFMMTLEDETLLWLSEEEYEAILSGRASCLERGSSVERWECF